MSERVVQVSLKESEWSRVFLAVAYAAGAAAREGEMVKHDLFLGASNTLRRAYPAAPDAKLAQANDNE